ncbi:MAG: M14 family zinc carboxypeptidase, partial [Bacillota bacterium]
MSQLFEIGGLIADRDGDGLADSVTARVLIDPRGTVADFVAAANFAARLGYGVVRYEPGLAGVAGDSQIAGPNVTVVRFGLPPEELQAIARETAGQALRAGQGLVAITGGGLDVRGELVVGGLDDEGRRQADGFIARDWAWTKPGRDVAVIIGPGRRVNVVAAESPTAIGSVSRETQADGQRAPEQRLRPSAAGPAGPVGPVDLAEPFVAGNLVSGPPAADGAPGGERPLCALVLGQRATAAEAVAACEVAYRLGVEASEMEWPLAFAESEAPRVLRTVGFEEIPGALGEVLVDGLGLVLRGGAQGLVAAARGLALSFRSPGEEAVPTGFAGPAATRRSLLDYLGLRSSAGQVAGAALVLADEMDGRGADGQGPRPAVRLDEPIQEARAFLKARAGEPVEVAPLQETVVSGRYEAAWEVDALRTAWAEALAALDKWRPAGPLSVSAGLGQPREIRDQLARDMARDLTSRGFARADFHLEVLSAYKPGLSWLSEVVIPDLKGLSLGSKARVVIRFAPCVPPPDGGKWLELPIRWLQELYPADDLIARELGLPADHVIFEMAEVSAVEPLAPTGPTYVVSVYRDEARDSASRPIYSASLTPPVAERPYLEAFPEAGLVHPTTGWLRVEAEGRSVFERRVETDLERVWGFLQKDFLPAVTAEVKAAGGSPPFFESLDFEVWVSAADEPLGLREERFSPLEALHEDVYFVTLDHFAALGRAMTGQPFRTPGPVLPWIHQRPGAGPEVRARLTRRSRPGPTVSFAGGERRGVEARQETLVKPIAPASSVLERVEIDEAGRPRRVTVGCTFATGEEARAAAARLALIPDLATAGLPGADLALTAGCALECRLVAPGAESVVATVPGPAVSADATPAQTTPKPVGAAPIVPYDHVLTLTEGKSILDRLATLAPARVWLAGRSFQGRPSYCLEVVEAGEGVISRNKLRLLRPTLVIVARHHANEVSSSNAALRLAEDLLTGPSGAELRRRVNLVVIPFENVDGVALHERMEKEHPTWKLHAARFNAAGQDVAGAYTDQNTAFGESRVLPLIWDLWRPDVISDEHGVPSHEWDQPFAGYVC